VTTPLDDLDVVADTLGGLVRRNQPLGARTTYRVGGAAALTVEPTDESELLAVAGSVAGRRLPVLVLGRGSNLLVADAGFAGLVVAPGPGFDTLTIEGTEVVAGAAVSLPTLARRTGAAGLTGLEGEVEELPAARLGFGYRHSDLTATQVVVAARHRLRPGDPTEARRAIDEIVRWRRANQPGGSNAGSVFTNPPGDSAGRLIDACGLKGLRLGTAEVSPKHANFIQADRGGSAADVRALMDLVRSRVAADTGVVLRTEVRMVGFDDEPEGRDDA
jgi:UDP-N-acetylmuramate dehydrogenase